MLQFVALPSQQTMSISNAVYKFNFAGLLDPNVEIVAWTGKSANVEYNDRPRIIETALDPVPYQPLINEWLTFAAEASSAITLAQAKKIKIDLIEAVYFYRRQRPYPYLGYQFSATDEATSAAVPYIGSMVGASGTAALATQINNNIVTRGNNGMSTIEAMVNTRLIEIGNAVQTRVAWIGDAGSNFEFANIAVPGRSGGFAAINYGAWTFLAVSGGADSSLSSIPWESEAPSQVVSLTLAQAGTLMTGIANRTTPLLSTKLSKIATVRGLATMASVIAFDATT